MLWNNVEPRKVDTFIREVFSKTLTKTFIQIKIKLYFLSTSLDFQASRSLTYYQWISFAILIINEFLLHKQSYGNASVVMSFPLQHFGNVSVRFLECPPQPFPFLQTASLYMLLQMVMGMIFSMHLFPPVAGSYPAVSAVILGNWMSLQLCPSGVSVEFWGLASADPKELNDVAKKTVTVMMWMI